MAAYLFMTGIAEYSTMKSMKLGLSAILLLIWMPMLLVAPQIIISFFYS